MKRVIKGMISKTEREWEAEEARYLVELDAYEEEFMGDEKREFFESYQSAVQDCIDRRTEAPEGSR